MGKFIADERRERIASIINERGSVRISDMANYFDVSKETIRKDLIYLEEHQMICKMHGGAIANRESRERPLQIRINENSEKKRKIAQKAYEYVEDNQIIMLDAGSTVLALADYFSVDNKNTLVTNSLSVAVLLAEREIPFCMIGGEFSHVTMSTNGLLASQALGMLNIDTVFLGSSGFQCSNGPSAKTLYDAQLKQDLIRNSHRKIVVADSSKLAENAFVQYATWSEIDFLITNEDAPEELLKELRKKVAVVLV